MNLCLLCGKPIYEHESYVVIGPDVPENHIRAHVEHAEQNAARWLEISYRAPGVLPEAPPATPDGP